MKVSASAGAKVGVSFYESHVLSSPGLGEFFKWRELADNVSSSENFATSMHVAYSDLVVTLESVTFQLSIVPADVASLSESVVRGVAQQISEQVASSEVVGKDFSRQDFDYLSTSESFGPGKFVAPTDAVSLADSVALTGAPALAESVTSSESTIAAITKSAADAVAVSEAGSLGLNLYVDLTYWPSDYTAQTIINF